MTYFERIEPAKPSYQHTRFIIEILQRASEVWSASAPKQGSEIANDLANRMAWKKQEVIENAFQYLKDNHETNFFPKPAKWDKALKYAESNSFNAGVNVDILKEIFFKNRMMKEYDKMIIEQLETFIQMEMAKRAIKERYIGAIYENGAVAPYGLLNYLYELLMIQLWIAKVWTVDNSAKRPQRAIEEFNQSENKNFRDWVKSGEFFNSVNKSAPMNMMTARKSDIEIIRAKRLIANEISDKFLRDNPNFRDNPLLNFN